MWAAVGAVSPDLTATVLGLGVLTGYHCSVAATESDFDLVFAALGKRKVRYLDREDIERLIALVEGGTRG